MAPQQSHTPPPLPTPVAACASLLWMTALLYLVQGIPIGLAFQAYPVLLRQGGAPLELIALVPLASLPWAFKFFWSPLVENRWSAAMGRRRSWIVPMQLLLALCLAAMAFQRFDAAHAPALLWLIAVASLASATQDIATDGLAADVLHGSGIAHINVLQVGGFMLGMLVGGPAVLLGVELLGQAASMLVLASIVVLCGVPVWRWREGAAAAVSQQRASLRRFFRRPLALRLMVAGMLATLTGSVLFGLAKLVLVDAGWSAASVAGLSGVGNSAMVLAGCALAALLLKWMARWHALLCGLAILAGASVLWLHISGAPASAGVPLVWLATVLIGLGIGVTSVCLYTLLMRHVQLGRQAATDFSIFQSTQTLGEIVIASAATALAARAGYAAGMLVGVASALLAIAMLLWVRRAAAHLDEEHD